MIGIIAITLFVIWLVNNKKEAAYEREVAEASAGLGPGEGNREDYIRDYPGVPEWQSNGNWQDSDGSRSGNPPWSRH